MLDASISPVAAPLSVLAGAGDRAIDEQSELLDALRDLVGSALTPHQRTVFNALARNGIPIDVLAERLATRRGARPDAP
jgi:hypothetical protein